MLLSVPCLIITFLVYSVIPELRNLHGKNLINYVVCLTVAYTTMAVIQLQGPTAGAQSPSCKWLGYVAYIGFVSSFFWLNVLCFDIWQTFRAVRQVQRKAQTKKLLFYSLYAWGCPLCILIFVYLVDHLPLFDVKWRPRMGQRSCFLDGELSQFKVGTFLFTNLLFLSDNRTVFFYYLYMIMLIQLVSNTTFFICTTYQIRKLRKETQEMTTGESRKFQTGQKR